MTADADVLIVGGGLVGASLACALGGGDLRVALVEPVAPEAERQPSYDDRTTALAPSSQRIFQALGIWPELRAEATPIRAVHVSEQGGFGFVRLSAEEEGLDALGYVIANRALGQVLPARAAAQPNVEVFCPATAESVAEEGDVLAVRLTGDGLDRVIRARLVVAADGAHSPMRALLRVGAEVRDYQQVAVIANLTPERDPAGRAFERFTPDGPLALLPTTGGRCALIWTVPKNQADAVMALSDQDFLAAVQQRFGYRLGRLLKAGRRNAFPLAMITACAFTAHRAAIIGNAAHSLHPVAGQGFNLALRDVAALAELLHEAGRSGSDPGRAALLAGYEAARQSDYRRVGGFTDLLVRVFSNRAPGLTSARNAALLALDLFPAGKRGILRYAMGRAGSLPRLARGLPLRGAQ
jgi:2-octaprenyl-6-methoxyphenol hydroxylase